MNFKIFEARKEECPNILTCKYNDFFAIIYPSKTILALRQGNTIRSFLHGTTGIKKENPSHNG